MLIQKSNNSLEQIQDMLKAYYPIVYLTSFEYDRAKQKIKGIAKKLNKDYQLYEWNCVDGLSKRDLGSDELSSVDNNEEPEQMLKYIISQIPNNQSEVYILEDFHDFIEERNIKILLRQLAERLRFYRKHIVIVSSVLTLPTELEKYVTVVEMALPDREDLEQVLQRVANSAKVEIGNDLKKKLIDAALGMTVMEADLAFCLAAVRNNFNTDSPRTVALEKEQIIKKSGLLDYFQVNEELRNVGGMEFLKNWLTTL